MTIVVMGVAGAGKTTIGSLLADRLGWRFVDGDQLHPAANVEKMARGMPLSDEDRLPWLAAVRKVMGESQARGENLIVACSALKQAYRDFLGGQIAWVYLKGSRELIRSRLDARQQHFAKSNLLDSQWAALEEPRDGLVVDIASEPGGIIEEIQTRLRL